jgi:hypothetical protein
MAILGIAGATDWMNSKSTKWGIDKVPKYRIFAGQATFLGRIGEMNFIEKKGIRLEV